MEGDQLMLSSNEVKRRILEANLVENIDTTASKWIEGGALDLRVSSVYRCREHVTEFTATERVLPPVREADRRGACWVLYPLEFYLFSTIEKVNMPDDLVGILHPRSSSFRGGLTVLCTQIDPGYSGTLTMGVYRVIPGNVALIGRGARLAALRFAKLDNTEEELYTGHWQGGVVTKQGVIEPW